MTLEHRDPSLPEELADARSAVVALAEDVTHTRAQGTLSAASLDRLAAATAHLSAVRYRYITGEPPNI